MIKAIRDAINERRFNKGQAWAIDQISLKRRNILDVVAEAVKNGRHSEYVRGVREVAEMINKARREG